MLLNIKKKWKALIILVGVLLLVLVFKYHHENIIDPQGGPSPWCDDLKNEPIKFSNGYSVLVHTTYCTTLGTDVGTYVQVYKTTEKPSRESLVFRFSPFESFEPHVEWVSSTHLKIFVEHLSQITKQNKSINGIEIEYVIGKQDYPQLISY